MRGLIQGTIDTEQVRRKMLAEMLSSWCYQGGLLLPASTLSVRTQVRSTHGHRLTRERERGRGGGGRVN